MIAQIPAMLVSFSAKLVSFPGKLDSSKFQPLAISIGRGGESRNANPCQVYHWLLRQLKSTPASPF
jgi:hypothetical protein